MKKFKRALALLLLPAALASSLAGCSKGGDGGGDSNQEDPGFVYTADFKDFKVDKLVQVNSAAWYDGKLYMLVSMNTGTETYTDPETGETYELETSQERMASANEDGTGFEILTDYVPLEVPEGMEGESFLSGMTIDKEGNIWLVENLYTYVESDTDGEDEGTAEPYVESTDEYYVRKLSPTGAELMRINASDLAAEGEEYMYVNSMAVDGEGNIYLSTGSSGIIVLDGEGNKIATVTLDQEGSYMDSMVTLPDGRVAVYVNTYTDEASSSKYLPVDLENGEFGEPLPAPDNASGAMNGGGDYDLYYQSGSSFFGFDIESGKSTRLFTWINVDVDDSTINSIAPTSDGRIICVATEYIADAPKGQIITLTKTDSAAVQEKKVLTYACMFMDYDIRRNILDFNRESDQYRIEVRDYSEYNTDEDYSAGLTKLTAEILGGNVPDIIAVDGMPVDQFAGKGLLEDLWPWIEQDTEIGGRDGVMEQVLNAASLDGKLYQVSPGFNINTVAGLPKVVGDRAGWSLQDLLAAYENMPEGADIFGRGTTRDEVMQACCAMLFDQMVNWDTGECGFDSQAFRDILEFANMFPETFDWENAGGELDPDGDAQRLLNGKQMLLMANISMPTDIQYYKAMCGGEAVFVGYPTGSGNGSGFTLLSGLAMSSKCENKDGAWEFIRTFLTEEYQTANTWSLPTNKAVFDSKLAEAMTPQYYTDPATGEQVEVATGGVFVGPGEEDYVEYFAMSQEEADQLMELINNTTSMYTYDEEIFNIVADAAAPYFAGQRSIDEVAKQVQSRVSLYVNERR